MDNVPANVDLSFLVLRVGKGDKSAFSNLYERTSAKLFGVICRILKKRELAEEALQDTYVKIWEQAGKYDPAVASPITWMCTIARNRAIDIGRQKQERVSANSEELDETMPGQTADPLMNALQNDELRRLTGCLEGLEEDRRRMIMLAYYEGWSREELGNTFEKPVNTIKTILRRSLALLKECLNGSK